jgi:hypothetical protein
MPEHRSRGGLEDDISIHIFTVSAAMVGVCLTVIGLFRVVTELNNVSSVADNLLAAEALAFLVSCVLSYVALRTRGREHKHLVEKVADGIFLTALLLMVFICGLIAYELV